MRLRLKNEFPTVQVMHLYEVRPRKDHCGIDLIPDALPFGRLWYAELRRDQQCDLGLTVREEDGQYGGKRKRKK